MMRTCLGLVAAIGLSVVVGATGACSRGATDVSGDSALTTSDGAPVAGGPTLAPVVLPDLSHVAPSVKDQLERAHATMTATLQPPSAPPSDRAAAYGEMGKLLMAAEFGQSAESCFQNARTLAPDDMRWPYYLGHLYRTQGDPARATASFAQALQLSPDDVATLIWLGESHLSEDRPEAAREAFTKALARRPASGAALAGLGRAALAERRYEEAVRRLEEALKHDKGADSVHYSLGLAYRGLGNLAKAENHLSRRGKGQMTVPDPLMDEVRRLLASTSSFESRGVAALEAGDHTSAAAYFRKGLDLAPDDASLHHRLGTALLLAGDIEAGRTEFETSLRLAPDLARAHYSLGVLLASSGQLRKATERLSTAVHHDPNYAEARVLLGDVLRHTGRAKEALQQYEEVLKLDPRVAEAPLGHALALADLGQYGRAVERLIAATVTFPDQVALMQALARLRAAAPDASVRDGAQAVALMQRVVGRGPTPEPEISEAMAMAYAEVGDFRQAVTWQRQAMAAAERAGGDASLVREMGANLSLFEREQPSRTPWADYAVP